MWRRAAEAGERDWIMKQRMLFLIRMYVVWLAVFAGQKVVFMLGNLCYGEGLAFGDWLAVVWHGLRLDSVTACYLMLLPFAVVAVSCFVKKFPLRKVLTPYYIVAALLVTVIFVGDVVLYRFWGAKMDANDLIYAQNPKDMLASVSVWACVGGAVVIGLLAWGLVWLLRRVTDKSLKGRGGWPSLLLVVVGGLLLLGVRGGTTESTANPSYAYFSSKPFLNHAALNPTFNMLHSLAKTENLAEQFQTFDEAGLARLTGDAYLSQGDISDTLLRTSRPNVLLLVWEGGGSEMVMNDSVGPNISRYAREGVYFSRCYANNFRTDRGLVSLLNGWPGLPTTSLMKKSDMGRKLPALARDMQAQGYHTSVVYGGDIDFTNMRGFFSETGFAEVRGSEAFPQSNKLSNWGAPDAYVLQPQEVPMREPFFSMVLTLSSHEPWDVPMSRLADAKQNAYAYTDSCVGVFVEALRKSPLWDSLLLIIVPDHGIPTGQYPSTADYHVSRIPMIWLGGAVEGPREVDVLMNQSDMAATLLAQMGMNAEDYIFSRNVLSATYQDRFALHAYKNGMNLIDEAGVTGLDCIDMKEIKNDTPPSAERLQRVKALLQLIYYKTGILK